MIKKLGILLLLVSFITVKCQTYAWMIVNQTNRIIRVTLFTNNGALQQFLSPSENIWYMPTTNWCFNKVKVEDMENPRTVVEMEMKNPGPACSSNTVYIGLSHGLFTITFTPRK